MKDRFRVRFNYKGWEIQHSRGLFWRECGGKVYQNKAYAEYLCGMLNMGTAPEGWYGKQKTPTETVGDKDGEGV